MQTRSRTSRGRKLFKKHRLRRKRDPRIPKDLRVELHRLSKETLLFYQHKANSNTPIINSVTVHIPNNGIKLQDSVSVCSNATTEKMYSPLYNNHNEVDEKSMSSDYSKTTTVIDFSLNDVGHFELSDKEDVKNRSNLENKFGICEYNNNSDIPNHNIKLSSPKVCKIKRKRRRISDTDTIIVSETLKNDTAVLESLSLTNGYCISPKKKHKQLSPSLDSNVQSVVINSTTEEKAFKIEKIKIKNIRSNPEIVTINNPPTQKNKLIIIADKLLPEGTVKIRRKTSPFSSKWQDKVDISQEISSNICNSYLQENLSQNDLNNVKNSQYSQEIQFKNSLMPITESRRENSLKIINSPNIKFTKDMKKLHKFIKKDVNLHPLYSENEISRDDSKKPDKLMKKDVRKEDKSCSKQEQSKIKESESKVTQKISTELETKSNDEVRSELTEFLLLRDKNETNKNNDSINEVLKKDVDVALHMPLIDFDDFNVDGGVLDRDVNSPITHLNEISNAPTIGCLTVQNMKKFDQTMHNGIKILEYLNENHLTQNENTFERSIKENDQPEQQDTVKDEKLDVVEFSETVTPNVDMKIDDIFNKNTNTIESEIDDDEISLHPGDLFDHSEEECDLEDNQKSSTHSITYSMSGSTFEAFKRKNAKECDARLGNNLSDNRRQENVQINGKVRELDSTKNNHKEPITNNMNVKHSTHFNNFNENGIIRDIGTNLTNQYEVADRMNFLFSRTCYYQLRGSCFKQNCKFIHELQELATKLSTVNVNVANKVIDYILSQKYFSFLKIFFIELIKQKSKFEAFNLCKNLYDNATNIMRDSISNIICELKKKEVKVQFIVHHLAEIVQNKDHSTCNLIAKQIENDIEFGEYWTIMKPLFMKSELSGKEQSKVLRECLDKRKNISHIEDVHKHLWPRIDTRKLDRHLINLFTERLRNFGIRPYTRWDTPSSPCNNGQEVQARIPKLTKGIVDLRQTLTLNRNDPRILKNIMCSLKTQTENREAEENATKDSGNLELIANGLPPVEKMPYKLYVIDDLKEPSSIFRDKFWKFYLQLGNLKEGLRHQDYDYVITILDEALSHSSKSLLTRSFYSILRNQIKISSTHLSAIIEITVRNGDSELLEVLQTVALHILVDLVDLGAWILAHRLLECMSIRLTLNKASSILFFAQIYIANNLDIEALDLLKQSKVIHTNHEKWLVDHDENDLHQRQLVLNLLLDSFNCKSSSHAFYLIEFLIKDQFNSYHPVDITSHLNKLILLILQESDSDNITNIGKLIFDNHLLVAENVLRKLIVSAFQIDVNLSKKLYQYALGLGMYKSLKLYNFPHVIINYDMEKDEIYLMLLIALQELAKSIGPGVEHASDRYLSIYIIFEDFSESKDFRLAEPSESYYENKFTKCKMAFFKILHERFTPPLRYSKRSKRFFKLIGRSILPQIMKIHKLPR